MNGYSPISYWEGAGNTESGRSDVEKSIEQGCRNGGLRFDMAGKGDCGLVTEL